MVQFSVFSFQWFSGAVGQWRRECVDSTFAKWGDRDAEEPRFGRIGVYAGLHWLHASGPATYQLPGLAA